MTTDSTKYFFKRGAVSARLNLVDTPLRGEYYYDGEHGKYYFGARYYDPFFGMWMSPDPAAVLFREVYAPLKWRDFIEKDILQRLNGEAVLLKHSFRASAQFANPYSYGGDPLNYVDPNGEFVNLAFGAAIGGGTAAYNCADQGGSCTKAVSTGVTVGALAGTAGGGAGALVGAAGGPIAGGTIGSGAGSGTGYLANGVMTGQDMNLGDFAKTTMDGAASGLIGSSVAIGVDASGINILGSVGSEALGNAAGNTYTAMSNGKRGDDLWTAFGYGAAMGASSAALSNVVNIAVNYDNLYDGTDIEYAVKEGDVIGFGFDANTGFWDKIISGLIMLVTGSPYSHMAVVDADQQGNRFVREANNTGSDVAVEWAELQDLKVGRNYKNRPYKVLARGQTFRVRYNKGNSENYNLFLRNCTTQASKWLGMPFVNNPGTFANNITGNVPYYNSFSITGPLLW
jgi:hypothetical protein